MRKKEAMHYWIEVVMNTKKGDGEEAMRYVQTTAMAVEEGREIGASCLGSSKMIIIHRSIGRY